jgi:pantoate kinase
LLKAAAFAPGHVTGFFSIHDTSKKMRHKGSRGAGICLSRGAHTIVGVTGSTSQGIDVFINNVKVEGSVTEYACRKILGYESLKVRVVSSLDLPMGQGFGMSAAGALSSCLALAEVLNRGIKREEIICAAHEAEINYHTGLGDVLPQSYGGIVIRKMEGCPPFGVVDTIKAKDTGCVLCVVGEGLITSKIITDDNQKRRITEVGTNCLRELQSDPSIQNMMRLSYAFSKGTGLLSKELDEAISAANKVGMASMSMLGESIFALGDCEKLRDVLSNYGEVFVCDIDNEGMRLE